MRQSATWETDRCSAGHEIGRGFMEYEVGRSVPTVSVLSQYNSTQAFVTYLKKTHFLLFYLSDLHHSFSCEPFLGIEHVRLQFSGHV
jgi:hypothetical protein